MSVLRTHSNDCNSQPRQELSVQMEEDQLNVLQDLSTVLLEVLWISAARAVPVVLLACIHDLQNFSAALSIAGHQTLLLRFCLVRTIPGCPSRAKATACGLSLFGSTMQVPLKTNCPITHSSPAVGAYVLFLAVL